MFLIFSIALAFIAAVQDDIGAASDPQPMIASVTAIPFRPNPQQPILVTATVADVESVGLVYRVGFGAETRMAMSQTGADLYQAAIPGQTAGALVRYQVIAVNKNGAVRFPDFADTIQYDGVVVLDPARPPSPYPVVEWFYDTQTSKSSVLAYQGKVYDAVATSLRRGRHWKVEMPKGHLFEMPGFLSYSMDEFAFNVPDQPGWAKTLARTQLWYAVAALAGEPKLDSFTVRVDVNGAPWEIRAFQANMDDQWRQYHGRTGSFYEFGSSGIDKKFPKDDDLSELAALNAIVNGPKAQIFDAYNVPRMVNFAALTSLICHWDNAQKNFYLYRDPTTNRWDADIWDVDASPTGPFFGGLDDGGQCNYQTVPFHNRQFGYNLYTFPFLQYAETRAMFQRRLRTLVDQIFTSGIPEALVAKFADPTDSDVLRTANADVAAAQHALLDYVRWQRDRINHDPTFPASWSGATPIVISEIHYAPLGGRAEEFVELVNLSSHEAIDLSGWRLDGADLTFPPGTVILPRGFLVVVADSQTFIRTYGSGHFVAADFARELHDSGERLILRLPNDTVVDEVTYGGPGWPQPTEGRSLERTNFDSISNNPAHWALSLTSHGTPNAPSNNAAFHLPPLLTSPGDQIHFEGSQAFVSLSASDLDDRQLEYFVEGLPPGLTLNSRTGIIEGTPPLGSSGNYHVTVRVRSGIQEESTSFVWTIERLLGSTADIHISADNAFELYLNGFLVGSGEDWFTAQTFSALPLQQGRNVIAVKAKDAGWLAGVLAEISVGGARFGTSRAWKVATEEEPGWSNGNFDDSHWSFATEYGEYGVYPWGTRAFGFPVLTPAKWLWSADNERDDTIYLRNSFFVAPSGPVADITVSADNAFELYLNGILIGSGDDWLTAQTYPQLALHSGANVVAIKAADAGEIAGLLVEITVDGQRSGTNQHWKCTTHESPGWKVLDFDDSAWPLAASYGAYGVASWSLRVAGFPTDTPAQWIWSEDNTHDGVVYCRTLLNG
jgi:hypothetical protein